MSKLDEIEARASKATARLSAWDARPERVSFREFSAVDNGAIRVRTLHLSCESALLASAENANETIPKLVDALRAVEAVHQKAPVYDTWASDCGHDDCDSVEADDGETYCPRSVVTYTCDHCAALSRDNMNGELPDWPCPTITAIREALNG